MNSGLSVSKVVTRSRPVAPKCVSVLLCVTSLAFGAGVFLTWLIMSFAKSCTSESEPNQGYYQPNTSSYSNTPEQSRPILLLTGDSLTEYGTKPDNAGWISLLQDRYCRSADVMPRGLGGYNTKYVFLPSWFLESALPVIEGELASLGTSPALITLWLGANDAALLDGRSAWQHIPLADYSTNLAQIVHTFRLKAPASQILLITPAHVNDARRLVDSPDGKLDRSNAAAGEYARACVEVAGELNIPVLDLYTFFNAMSESDRASYLEDGLHFNAKGNRAVDQELQAIIATAFPELLSRLGVWDIPTYQTYKTISTRLLIFAFPPEASDIMEEALNAGAGVQQALEAMRVAGETVTRMEEDYAFWMAQYKRQTREMAECVSAEGQEKGEERTHYQALLQALGDTKHGLDFASRSLTEARQEVASARAEINSARQFFLQVAPSNPPANSGDKTISNGSEVGNVATPPIANAAQQTPTQTPTQTPKRQRSETVRLSSPPKRTRYTRSFLWDSDGEMHHFPVGFEIPHCNVSRAWELWCCGDSRQMYPPFRILLTRDLPNRDLKKTYSEYRFAMVWIEEEVRARGGWVDEDHPAPEAAAAMFDRVKAGIAIMRNAGGRQKQPVENLQWTTATALLRKRAKLGAQAPQVPQA
ncbi:hypothetical protein BBJ28_00002103 [Nothophytophthora sp. Chile5]|nr:hypothetical protein BBJ28_00002103 [Nothophytophthora sp. Chile5]